MNKINRKIEYALMALKYMSQKIPGELTAAKEVSDTFGIPFDATARVMQVMAQKSWLRSEHGALGGYQITKDLSKVSFRDLMEVIEGPMAIVRCLHKENPCEIIDSCNIVSPLATLNSKLNEFYQGLNLKDLLLDTSPSRPFRKKNLEEVSHG